MPRLLLEQLLCGVISMATAKPIWRSVTQAASVFDPSGSSLCHSDFAGFGRCLAAGVVEVRYGSSNGLTTSSAQIFHQGIAGPESDGTISVGNSAELGDEFGLVLAATRKGSFDNLVIGVPYEDLSGAEIAGLVHVLKGTSSGFSPLGGSQVLSQGNSGVQGTPEDNDEFGYSVATGDFNGDGQAIWPSGFRVRDYRAKTWAGAVQIFFGAGSSSNVFTTTDNRFISQAVIPGLAVSTRISWGLRSRPEISMRTGNSTWPSGRRANISERYFMPDL